MKNCELTEIGAGGCQKGFVEFKSKENLIDLMMKTNLFFSANNNVQKFAKLGISKNENFNFETINSYHFTKYGRISLEFSEYLEPTQEFIEVVRDAIKSKDLNAPEDLASSNEIDSKKQLDTKNVEKLNQIIEEFGQSVPTEVILGGRAHFDGFKRSTGETSDDNAMDIDTEFFLEGRSTNNSSNCTKLFGGKRPNRLENFDEEAWIKSLNEDYKNWNCIEFRKPISIFQLLPDDLYKQVIKSVGKRIHYSTIENFNYQLEESGKPRIFELRNVPPNISKIIQNKDADCNIFATVIDTAESKNDFFNCQILCPPNGKPRLIIHCVQKEF